RRRRDYYVKHDQPKRLFCRQLCKNARRSLQAEHLKPALAVVEQKVSPPCTRTVKEIRSMVEHFKAVPDFRGRFESYPLWSMLTILFLATLCGAPRGQKDIAKFARGLSQAQRRALGIGATAKASIPHRHSRPFAGCSNASTLRRWRKPFWPSRSKCVARRPRSN